MDHHQNAPRQNAPTVQNTSSASSGVPPSSSSSSMGTTTGVAVHYPPSAPYAVGTYPPCANEAAMYGPPVGPMYSQQPFAAPPSLYVDNHFDIGPISHHPSPLVGVDQTMAFPPPAFTAQHPQKNVAQGKKRRRVDPSMNAAEPTLKRRASVDGSPLSSQSAFPALASIGTQQHKPQQCAASSSKTSMVTSRPDKIFSENADLRAEIVGLRANEQTDRQRADLDRQRADLDRRQIERLWATIDRLREEIDRLRAENDRLREGAE